MKGAALGLLVGLAVGAVNQWFTWRMVLRAGGSKQAVVGRYLGGCALRLLLDAGALLLGWALTRAAAGIIAAAGGLLLATAAFTWWQYRTYRAGLAERGEGKR